MKHFLLTVVVIALLAAPAVAQDIETMMAGRAQIGAGLISEAWLHNPAVLGMQRTADPLDGGNWAHSASGVYEIDGDVDFRALTWGAHPHGQRWGVGAGVVDVAGMESIGLGAGWGTPDGRLSAGLNYQSVDTAESDADIFDFAVGGRLSGICPALTEGTWGIVARDITDEMEATFDIGIGYESELWRVAADLEDVSDEIDSVFQLGVAHRFGSMNQWQVGAGVDDEDLTAGFTYRPTTDAEVSPWKIGVAWLEGDGGADDAWVIGAGANW
ncbi:MAG: hypothetical protein ACLFU7_00740 [Armatimonadota bacterium]